MWFPILTMVTVVMMTVVTMMTLTNSRSINIQSSMGTIYGGKNKRKRQMKSNYCYYTAR